MERGGSSSFSATWALPVAAALGCLQPGIDPVFLALLSQASHVPFAAHGIIVCGTQAGAALGSLAVWRLGPALPHRTVIGATVIALACSLATAVVDDTGALLAIRCCYGLMMGMVYAYAMGRYAARKPNRAFGAVFLIQLVLSTVVSLVLPEAERVVGADATLTVLALAPAGALVAVLLMPARDTLREDSADAARAVVPIAGWALAAATFWFICATMLVWSFSAGLAAEAGIGNRTIGQAVALGSIVGAATAFAVMREKMLVPLPATALLAGAALIAPILLTKPHADLAFVVSIVLLNIGSTAIIIRCSGMAAAASADSRFRIFVAFTHSLGLIAGPMLGTIMIHAVGGDGLFIGVVMALSCGLGSVILAGFGSMRGVQRAPARYRAAIVAETRIALD